MAERTGNNHNKGEYICLDSERAVTPSSSSGDQNGGLLYTTEMEQGSSNEEQYPHNVEVGCSVCVADVQADEIPFVMQTQVGSSGQFYHFVNAIHGEWVKVGTAANGLAMTVSYGYTAAAGTSSSAAETQRSAQSRAIDSSTCASASFTASLDVTLGTEATYGGPFVKTTVDLSTTIGFSSTVGAKTCGGNTDTASSSVARAVNRATSWDQSITETRSFSLSIPSQIPSGVPEAETMLTLGVDVWQWQWTIVENGQEGVSTKAYQSKAASVFLFAPVPTGATEKRPCCYPGQEYGILWYPFNCKTSAGLLPGAENATHCKVGPPGGSVAETWSAQQVVEWLDTLELSEAYDAVVTGRRLDGPAIDSLLRFVDESTASYSSVMNVFGAIPSGDALKILRGLIELRTVR
jgi:hypothetical protein